MCKENFLFFVKRGVEGAKGGFTPELRCLTPELRFACTGLSTLDAYGVRLARRSKAVGLEDG
jgi:hypothetical protein